MIKIAICDDIEIMTKSMKQIVLRHDYGEEIEVDCFISGIGLLESVNKNRYDILIIDIELAENPKTFYENGMLVSNKIKNIYPEVIIIFITGKCGYERQLLSFEPFRFVKKPIMDKELIEAVNSAIKRIDSWEEKLFLVKVNNITFPVEIKKIIYFESKSPHISMHCIDEVISFRRRLDSIEKELATITNDFVRTGKGHLLNMNYIKRYSSRSVTIIDGTEILISRRYLKTFMDKMNNR